MIHADAKTETNGLFGSKATDQDLRRFVESSLGAEVDELLRRPLAESTSFPCEILTARFGERSVELFFKDFGTCRLPRSSDDGPAREIEIYRRVLDPLVRRIQGWQQRLDGGLVFRRGEQLQRDFEARRHAFPLAAHGVSHAEDRRARAINLILIGKSRADSPVRRLPFAGLSGLCRN